ncbi:MAG TPA: CaiB/BaiF CoA-transferase family protein [Steroidobacteraceae bacterium]|nr:CaiB/BaiF CoA-transferase family protein [Steroidobacteraceae bacterium]
MGPLENLRIVEIAGIGPGPFCGMLLADMGADVLRIDRKDGGGAPIELDASRDILARGRRSVALDLKRPEGVALALDIIDKADAVFEGFRPGVAERLGIGPEACMARNPKLVYGRMTGWGQTGPLAQRAGHDINYIALSGALYMIGRQGEKPLPPINLVGDFGGGGLLLAFGMLCALLEARTSGKGQVVDAAMFEGASLLMSGVHALRAMQLWRDERGTNMGDTGAHYYEVYETQDGQFMAAGPAEPQFYRELIERLGVDAGTFAEQMNPQKWPALKEKLAEVFRTKTREEWCAIFEGSDACVSPVLSPSEAPRHPHGLARGSFVEIDGVVQPAPAPRFSRTAPQVRRGPPEPGEGGTEALEEWGIPKRAIDAARAADAIRQERFA